LRYGTTPAWLPAVESFPPLLDLQIARCGVSWRQATADGAIKVSTITNQPNSTVREVALHKKRGIAADDMVKSKSLDGGRSRLA